MSVKYNKHPLISPGIRARLKNAFILLGCMAFHPFYANGASTMNPVPINITGTVIATAACTFSSDQVITVEFGDVWINEITGDKYKQPVPYTLNCDGDADGKTLKMQWVGTVSAFNSALLTTDIKNLGIKLLQNNTQVSPNTSFTIDGASPPALEVVVVKNTGASFNNGQEFNASATLKVDYQ
ncbi:fimbrial protein [Pantoea agglomerans]|uniref:fimbrial protein n=1 Tax=Enterobacter agglomerans TaxID=549 RepID=UPI003C7C919C